MNAGNSTYTIIISATMTMLICWPIGLGCGAVIEKTLIEHIRNYKAAHPIPPDPVEQPIEDEEFEQFQQQREQEEELVV